MTLQIVRDWLLRFNAEGPAGLIDRKAPRSTPKLGATERQALLQMVERGPMPDIHGVVRTFDGIAGPLAVSGCAVSVIGPVQFRSLPMPSYPELRLGLVGRRQMMRAMAAARPDSVYIATEGTLGGAARAACHALRWPYTTAFHTRFPDYVHARTGLPRAWTWAVLRRFHRHSAAVLAATDALGAELATRGFGRVVRWGAASTSRRSSPHRATAMAGRRGRSCCMWVGGR